MSNDVAKKFKEITGYDIFDEIPEVKDVWKVVENKGTEECYDHMKIGNHVNLSFNDRGPTIGSIGMARISIAEPTWEECDGVVYHIRAPHGGTFKRCTKQELHPQTLEEVLFGPSMRVQAKE